MFYTRGRQSYYIDAKLIYLSECIKEGFMGAEWDVKPAWEYILDHVEGY